MKFNKSFYLVFSGIALIILAIGLIIVENILPHQACAFDGDKAYSDVIKQVEYGARIPGSTSHQKTQQLITSRLESYGWSVVTLKQEIEGHIAYNIMATRNSTDVANLVLGAHYDSRIYADNDADVSLQKLPVPAANDGASGVALLLEFARCLPTNSVPVSLVFFDIEDNGRLPGWNWILGSKALANSLEKQPKVVIVVDMIGDKNLDIFKERNSDPELTEQIWRTAKDLGYGNFFIPEYKYQVLDDHMPFKDNGARVVDIIDLDYDYWHTTQDTPDKVSPKSLQMVGETLLEWIYNYGDCVMKNNCPPQR